MKLLQELRRGWQGLSQPSVAFGVGHAAFWLALATAWRWGLSLLRPDIFFTPYLPAVFLATAVAGARNGIGTAIAGGILGVVVNFSDARPDSARFVLLTMYWVVCAFMIWGVEQYRSLVARERRIGKRVIEEEEYRKLLVAELQHRLKNKLTTIHAVLHQLLENEPQIWAAIDHRIRALSTTDDLVGRSDNAGCDIMDLLLAELGPYGHVRFDLNGDALFLPEKLAVSLGLIFHELATNAAKYGAFSARHGFLQVSWTTSDDRLVVTWDETEGPPVETVGPAGFGAKLLKSALTSFDGKTEITYLRTGVHCTMQCRIPRK